MCDGFYNMKVILNVLVGLEYWVIRVLHGIYVFLFIDVDNMVVNLSTSETFDKNLKSIYPNVPCAYNIVHNLMIHITMSS